MTGQKYSRTDISRLAAMSRAYRDAEADITGAVVQEMRTVTSREHQKRVARMFGLEEEELEKYAPGRVLRSSKGNVHRAELRDVEDVLRDVLRHIEQGKLSDGDQLPPREVFTQEYHCSKKTHGEVVRRLITKGLVRRPGGNGGVLVVSSHE